MKNSFDKNPHLQGDDQLLDRLAGLDGITSNPEDSFKEDRAKNRVHVLAEVSGEIRGNIDRWLIVVKLARTGRYCLSKKGSSLTY